MAMPALRQPTQVFGDRAARILILLAMPGLALCVFLATLAIIDTYGNQNASGFWSASNAWRFGYVVATLFVLLFFFVVWWPYLKWTRKKFASALTLGALALAQVLAWQPAWSSSGCATEDILRQSQTIGCAGLWWIITPLVWWGFLAFRKSVHASIRKAEKERVMSSTAMRLTISLGLIPLLPGVFWFAGTFFSDLLKWNSDWAVLTAFEICAIIAVVLWYAIWRHTIPKNGIRRKLTLLLMILTLACPTVVWAGISSGGWTQTLCSIFPVFMLAILFVGSAMLWRQARPLYTGVIGADLLEVAVRCPECDYSLRGLREVRCPECGWQSTVDEVVARSLEMALAVD